MTNSLQSRVGRVIAGGLHALVDRIEDQAPEAVMEQSLREAETVVADVRHELGLVSANRHLAQQQHGSLNAQHEKLGAQLQSALDAGRDDLAQAAVARQLDIEDQLPVLEATLADYARQESELTGYVAALLAKRREMADALQQFRRSRASSAGGAAVAAAVPPAQRAQQRIDAVSGAFDRVYQRHTGLSGTDRTAGLEQTARLGELDDLARRDKIAQRMALLRAGRP